MPSGGRGRKFESSHPDQVQEEKGPYNLLGLFLFGLGRKLELNQSSHRGQRSWPTSRPKVGSSSHPDHIFPFQIKLLQHSQLGHCLFVGSDCGDFVGISCPSITFWSQLPRIEDPPTFNYSPDRLRVADIFQWIGIEQNNISELADFESP